MSDYLLGGKIRRLAINLFCCKNHSLHGGFDPATARVAAQCLGLLRQRSEAGRHFCLARARKIVSRVLGYFHISGNDFHAQ